jgi:hypothetical protein
MRLLDYIRKEFDFPISHSTIASYDAILEQDSPQNPEKAM